MSYEYTFTRLDKLRKTFEQLLRTNEQLVEKNKKLNLAIQSMESTALGRENVLRSISKDLENLKAKLNKEERET